MSTDLNELNNLNMTRSFSKKDSKRNTRSSFQDVANEILTNKTEKDDNIKEGILAPSSAHSKRRTIVGIKPEGAMNATHSRRVSQQSIKENPIAVNPTGEEEKHSKMQEEFKQDILTRQALDEIKDNIDMFKMDINKAINDLRNEQEKIELGEIKTDIKILQDEIEKDLKMTRIQNDKDFETIKESFASFREEVFELIDQIVKQNEDKILGLYKEIKLYEEEVNKRFLIVENKQEEYINLLKLVMETSEDENTRRLVTQFLIDDADVFEANKLRYQKEFEEQRMKERKEIEEKERLKLQVRLKAEEAELLDEAREEAELMKLENEARLREEEILKKREEEFVRKAEEKIRLKEDEEFRKKILKEEELEARYLELEITETNAMNNVEENLIKMENLTLNLPSLVKACKIQDTASKIGFDWSDITGALEKLEEEIEELLEAYQEGNKEDIEEELGDVLFTIVNVSRFLDMDPELALNKANNKFKKRFASLEEMALEKNLDLKDMKIEELDELWNLVKTREC